ncbi:MAG: hypothetical protein FH749_06985 [Firmicutes bacterium]|nr:hypothetical protein [Bacillota bacterium]
MILTKAMQSMWVARCDKCKATVSQGTCRETVQEHARQHKFLTGHNVRLGAILENTTNRASKVNTAQSGKVNTAQSGKASGRVQVGERA